MTAEQRFATGIRVGIGQTAHCDVCNATLRPNDSVEVLVLFDGAHVELVTTRGPSCARGQLRAETSRPCWLVRGTLTPAVDGRGRSELILSGASIVDRTE